MSFDPTKLSERELLKLSEVINSHAVGEALDADDVAPADRAYLSEIEDAVQRCCDEAGKDPRHTEFVEIITGPGFLNAPLSWLQRCKPAWTASGPLLHDLLVKWKTAHEADNGKREEAERQGQHWVASDKVIVDGVPVDDRGNRGARERIEADRILDPIIIWAADRIMAHPRYAPEPRPGEPRAMLVWDDVRISRSSLVGFYRPAPDPAKIDPMQAPIWTLAMAVAWIQSKSADAVREHWLDWLEACGELHPHDDGSFYREPRQRPSFRKLIDASPENAEAWGALRQALHKGEVSATRASTGATVLQSSWPDPEADELDHDVQLNGADVLRRWRPAVDECQDATAAAATEAAEPGVEKRGGQSGHRAPVARIKLRGRPPKYTAECEAAARRIAAEKKASHRASDKTDMALIRAVQAWWENEYEEPAPVDETVRSWLTMWGL